MTDGPTSQSYFAENYGRMSIWQGTQQSTVKRPSALIYSSSFEGEDNNFIIPIPQTENSNEMVRTRLANG